MSDGKIRDIQLDLIAHGNERVEWEGWGESIRASLPGLVKMALDEGMTKAEIALLTRVSRDTVERATHHKKVVA
jgi:predicted transposase YdaD